MPIWGGKTGAIDKTVLDHWKKYDLKRYVETNWKELGPKLAGGKVNVWVGDADDYFLNVAVARFRDNDRTAPRPEVRREDHHRGPEGAHPRRRDPHRDPRRDGEANGVTRWV